MEEKTNHSLCLTNWDVRFMCDCKKKSKAINIHKGIAHEISTHGVYILSDHQICERKKVSMQLLIPSPQVGAPTKIVKTIGNSLITSPKEEKYLTEIEFLSFEEGGLNVLEKNLHEHFDSTFSMHVPRQA